MNFPDYVAFTLDRLEENGFCAYLVGGCVRDYIMGNVPNDYDITTNALPDEIEKCFCDIKTLDIGKKHGTITLVFDKETVEVTTYRIDGEYKDSRHPESVTFTDRVEDDLARRDFTMNAIAFSPKRGFVDPFDGKGDIENKIIRCVGNAQNRFDEDALRIMRALRFASRLGFQIEESTKIAIFDKKELLLNIALERINAELDGLVFTKFSWMVVAEFFEVFRTIIPVLLHVKYKALERASQFDLSVSRCVFFSSVSDGDALKNELKRLKFDNVAIKRILSVLSYVPEYYDKCSDYDIKKLVSKIDVLPSRNLYHVMYCLTGEEKYLGAVERLCEFEKNGECMSVKQLCVKGNEIIEKYNMNPSLTGRVLEKLLNDVIEGKIFNEKSLLLNRASKYI